MEDCLNRTSVGLKVGVLTIVILTVALPQSNQRGIERRISILLMSGAI